MRMTLKELAVENFGGIKKEIILFNDNTTLAGPNGAGKTRMQSAFFWLLFGKDVNQKTKFEVRPLDSSNRPIQGLVVKVRAVLNIDGKEVTLRKEEHERIVRDEHRGYTSKYWINEVPKLENEYKQGIADIISEDRCRLLTDLKYFCEGLHWEQRRKILYGMVEVGTPQGFDDLIERVAGRDIKEYKKVLQDRRRLYVKQRDEIPPRMDELQKRLTRYEQTEDQAELMNKRLVLQSDLSSLNNTRSEVRKKESERQKLIDEKISLQSARGLHESNLRVLLSSKLTEEQATLRQQLSSHKIEVIKLNEEMLKAISRHDEVTENLTKAEIKLSEYRDKYHQLKNTDIETICYACKQTLPPTEIENNKANHANLIEDIKKDAQQAKNLVVELKSEAANKKEELDKTERDYEAKRIEHTEMAREIDGMITSIEQQKKDLQEPDYSSDEKWIGLTRQIKSLENDIGEPVSEQIEKIDEQRGVIERELANLNAALASLDQSKKDTERIETLKNEQKNISQSIADIDSELSQIDTYTVQESLDIEMAVNSLFDGIQWKMFDYHLNGEIDDKRCDATMNGVPFQELSTGEQIKAGVSGINTLSTFYDCYLPLFIDHDESITLPIETKTQTIRLLVDKNIDELEVRN